MSVVLFSGQGSQYVGMANDIFSNSDVAKDLINSADDILGYNLSKIMFEGPSEKLRETRYTQVAIFLHSAVLFELLKTKIEVLAAAGHSVGELSALYSSGVIGFEDAIKLVSTRGELMYKAGLEKPGTMFAIIGLADENIDDICAKLNDPKNGNILVPANYNSPGQVVISGSRDYLKNSVEKFKDSGARIVKELQVSGAFHSPLLESARDEFSQLLDTISFKDASFPIYTNVDAESETDSQLLKDKLKLQLVSPVKWSQSLVAMKDSGISNFIELGPGKVLQGLVKRTLSDVSISGYDKYSDIEKIS
ncbi:ACP S-malonyltransferase [Candidatus Kapabacteria bacterium]|nr:ACP S-malonyltransferase [Candidatus Kapabacteria bacterium]